MPVKIRESLLFLFVLICCAYSNRLFAQEDFNVDYKKIETASQDKNSSFYFPNLLKRYLVADSSLTNEEKRFLYFGYSYTKSYDKLDNTDKTDYNDSVRMLVKKGKLEDADLKKLITFTGNLLKTDPLNMRMLNYQAYGYEKTGQHAQSELNKKKIGIVADAIINTGDGKSVKTAFHVTNVRDEYDIIGLLGFEFGGSQSLVEEHYDKMSIKENKYGINELYFNVYRSIEKFREAFMNGNKNDQKK